MLTADATLLAHLASVVNCTNIELDRPRSTEHNPNELINHHFVHPPQVRLIAGLLAGIGSWQQLLAALGDRVFDELDSLAMMNDSVVRRNTCFVATSFCCCFVHLLHCLVHSREGAGRF